MEPELKIYLEEMEGRISGQFQAIRTEISEVLEVVNDIKENTNNILEKTEKSEK